MHAFDLAPASRDSEGALVVPPLSDSSSDGGSLDEFATGSDGDATWTCAIPVVVVQFKAAVCMTLLDQVSCTPAPSRRAHKRSYLPTTMDGLPRHSAHVAAHGQIWVSNPEVQAQNVLMRKWNINSASHSSCTQTLEEYDNMFNSPLGLQ
jgi:hypothetical protein